MQPISRVSNIWSDPTLTRSFTTGVSLHSHTCASEESLSFIHKMFTDKPLLGRIFSLYERVMVKRHHFQLDFVLANWRPPLPPRDAFDLEHKQILDLGLEPLISISDHDNIQAPMLLRTIPAARRIPVSVEWTAPFGITAFHIGIHNLPSPEGTSWMQRLKQFTAAPCDGALFGLLQELDAIPQVLIVLNHPVWDLYRIGAHLHAAELERFLDVNGSFIHALELNGLRHARENSEVASVARRRSHLLISGGDRHGLEPNANINLTNASSFNDFVREIRTMRYSHVLFLEQYLKPWEQRILDSTLDAVTDFPQFTPGWQRWDERAFYCDTEGSMRPLSELWSNGKPPLPLRFAIKVMRLLSSRTFVKTLHLAFPGVNTMILDPESAKKLS